MQHKVLFVLSALLVSVSAGAAPKVKKPVVCDVFHVVKTDHRVVALCLGGRTPRVLVRFIVTEIPVAENDTDVRKVAIGYTSVEQ